MHNRWHSIGASNTYGGALDCSLAFLAASFAFAARDVVLTTGTLALQEAAWH